MKREGLLFYLKNKIFTQKKIFIKQYISEKKIKRKEERLCAVVTVYFSKSGKAEATATTGKEM